MAIRAPDGANKRFWSSFLRSYLFSKDFENSNTNRERVRKTFLEVEFEIEMKT